MLPRYEYKFVRLEQDKNWWASLPTLSQEARDGYQKVIRQHAAEGWRLVQIFAPDLGFQGSALYFELIFERPVE